MARKTKYIFVVGGVMSGVGKGVASSSIGKILESRGLSVTAVKIDPYVNVDAGTMNPTEHGEVFVLDDGMECDQDMGNYERFLDRDLDRQNYMTTGSVYLSVIRKERNLEYDGKFVSVVPYIPLEVISKIETAAEKDKADIVIVEIGGTVGEYENILFLEAVRMLKIKCKDDMALILVSFLPALGVGGTELKTKPTQHAVRSVNAVGLQPDIVIARASVPIDEKRKEKIAFHCSVRPEDVISAPDVSNIYEVPLNFEKDNLGDILLQKLNLEGKRRGMEEWEKFMQKVREASISVRIGIVGKYFDTGNFLLSDSYISVIESLKHAAYALNRKPVIEWLNAEQFDPDKKEFKENLKSLESFDGILIPGGFGSRGVAGKIEAIRHCREHNIPYLGLCYGMQLAVIEYARNVAGMKDAHTTEVDKKTSHPVIDILPEQKKLMEEKNYGGTMRLGAYPAMLKKGTIAHDAYKKTYNLQLSTNNLISERHRHRYEVNPEYIKKLEEKGLVFSASSPDGRLMEIAELPKETHPFFLGTQFHPEFKSRPLRPHPLFLEFIKSATTSKSG
ncbi:CTP synthase [Candidatus Jorgensenbacteria bacterium RIFCSPLOWO2_01_FULL_45_25b]|uniref:CTP synthase n=1 Tax=Candidatus Jorgensenbacteria bacterium RIFCSPLOWO2_01_FULL_45_25b TaxID=1798471 RepID=A0A1F6BXA0_9BACT|nr:MAG: CTP synthase [Candidatus Jorgensenbacteria bacterium RIFCSPLOWO2_01_FULL_45_25b]